MLSKVKSVSGKYLDNHFTFTYYPAVLGGSSEIKEGKTGKTVSFFVPCKCVFPANCGLIYP